MCTTNINILAMDRQVFWQKLISIALMLGNGLEISSNGFNTFIQFLFLFIKVNSSITVIKDY